MDDSKPANKGVQASVAILRDSNTSRKYFFKAHKSSHVFRQERKILFGLDESVTPRAICFTLKPQKGIVMELAEGGDLSSDYWYRPDNPLKFHNYQELIQAVAYFVASIAAIHSKGYLHNDLRPNNVIFSHPHRLQVIDFGLSRKIGKKGFHSQCTLNSPPETAFLTSTKDRYQNINSTSSDWYTVGVLTHFFMAKGLFCINPGNFEDDACSPGQQEMFWPYKSIKIDSETKKVIYDWTPAPPVPFPDDLKDFISKLIVVDPLKRDFRGSKLVSLLKHSIFSSINWNLIDSKLKI